MECSDGSRTAFFIDTNARRDKRPYFAANAAALLAKATLLMLTLVALRRVLHSRRGDAGRNALCWWCSVTFVARVLTQMLFFWHRRISWTGEVLAEAGFIIPLSLLSLGYGAASNDAPLEWAGRDGVGALLFVAGTLLNVGSEAERHLYRTPGRLYTAGLWTLARHINYGGEVLSFVGHALPCGLGQLWVPCLMGVGMACYSVPELDHYLAEKYGAEWRSRGRLRPICCLAAPRARKARRCGGVRDGARRRQNRQTRRRRGIVRRRRSTPLQRRRRRK